MLSQQQLTLEQPKPEDVLSFWFVQCKPRQWFQKDPEFDQLITRKFSHLHKMASAGELFSWRETPSGRLAEVIILDQFSRNIFRGDPRAYAFDALALVLSQEAVQCGDDLQLPANEAPLRPGNSRRAFLYMPYMHSESRMIQEISVALFAQPGLEDSRRFATGHKAIIDRFGRYPHRNKILGRESTSAERDFLCRPCSSY